MEALNRKTVLRIFLGLIALQTFILLAISANFLLAQTYDTATTPDSTTTDYMTDDGTITNDNTMTDDTTDGTTDYATTDDSGDNITAPDDSAIDTTTMDDSTNDTTNDIAATPLTLTFFERLEPPLSGDQRISIVSNQEIFSCIFKIYGPKYAEFSAIKDGPTNFHIIWRTEDFPDGYYTIKAVANNNTETADVRLDAEIKNQIATEYQVPTTETPTETSTTEIVTSIPAESPYPTKPTEPIPAKTVTTSPSFDNPLSKPVHLEPNDSRPEQSSLEFTFTSKCQEEGFSAEECLKYNQLPAECRKTNIISAKDCEKAMFIKYGPQECIQAKIFNSPECNKFMFNKYAPQDCHNAGILNLEACKKYMFEKYNGAENIPTDKFPLDCVKANAQTAAACEKIMQKIYMPEECVEQGIESEDGCELYFQEKYMSPECRAAGNKTRQECDKTMFKKFGPPECKTAGIDDEKECEEYILGKYAPRINCAGLEDWQCKDFIKEGHVGNIVAKQTVYDKINEKKSELIGKSINAAEMESKFTEENLIPFAQKDIDLKILAAEQAIVLNEEDNLIQTAPIMFMMDSDQDSLPDDIEKRIGTNPFKADSDGDSYSDYEEITNGYNPLGEGKFEKVLAPVEKAILGNSSLGHPTIEGRKTDTFSVKEISDIKDDQNNFTEGYLLTGEAQPNSVATLYIYSDLPVVVTVDTDQYGNWRYQLDQSLIEGEHEVYIAINDDTGKVMEKSKPLNFFVKEARAVSVKDFVSTTKAPSAEIKETESLVYYYLLAALSMSLIGVFLFLSIIYSRKKNQPLE